MVLCADPHTPSKSGRIKEFSACLATLVIVWAPMRK
jgi:hypothetical protein